MRYIILSGNSNVYVTLYKHISRYNTQLIGGLIYVNEIYQENGQVYVRSTAPVRQLKTNRSLLKYILLSIITFGIYGMVVICGIANDLNVIASRYDGRKTMHFALLLFLICPITLFIAYFVWFHKISARIGNELKRRNINYEISASTFWLWGVLGSIIPIGFFVYMHKLITASNMLAEHYNMYG